MTKRLKLIAASALSALISTGACAQAAATDQCEQGASFRGGLVAYANGDFPTAKQTFQSLADNGDPCGEYWLGEMYNLGQGVPKDQGKHVELMRQSAGQGYSKARARLYVLGR